ncbi:hypothetical protein RvY_04059 [Ramazzottius varieornatus]|uniref:Uncharacterized protein n=1 Tax=Ramazzottius varieornatus TaxID=947166 RepID=A0A1D1UQ99_RAMVA|nr:hypothetical protein RvY_04059 [Ramazzottius varieornatus]
MAARRRARDNSVEEEDAELPEEASKTTGRSTRKRTVKDMAESEEDPEKQRLQKAHSKRKLYAAWLMNGSGIPSLTFFIDS